MSFPGQSSTNGRKGIVERPVRTENYIQRTTAKARYELGDIVAFNVTKQPVIGTVTSRGMRYIKVAHDGRSTPIAVNLLYKVSEYTKKGHWDFLTIKARHDLLTEIKAPVFYTNKNWRDLDPTIRDILKDGSSVGGGTSMSTGSSLHSQGNGSEPGNFNGNKRAVGYKNHKNDKTDKVHQTNDASMQSTVSPTDTTIQRA